ncbi:MAG: hypothetical protein GY737_29045 [Desulfobacteraceae bacterium]|nr:hypothetical protein [Desulfobacteraceae bacterium]
MQHLIRGFYKKIIHPVDPAFFMTRYAVKAVLACVAALFAGMGLGVPDLLLQWGVFGAFIVMLSRAGNSFQERKRVALRVVFISSLLVPLSTLAGGTDFLREAYVFLLAFFAFFCAALGLPAMITGLGILLLNLFALGDPDTLAAGGERALLVLMGGVIAYAVNFYFLPVYPRRILARAGSAALTDLGDFFTVVAKRIEEKHPPEEVDKLQDRARKSVRRYREIMEAMNMDPMAGLDRNQGPTALYAALVRLLTAVINLNQNSRLDRESPLYDGVRQTFAALAADAALSFERLAQNLSGGEPLDPAPMDLAVDELENRLLELGAYKRGDAVREEFLEIWGIVHALRNLARELETMTHLGIEERK